MGAPGSRTKETSCPRDQHGWWMLSMQSSDVKFKVLKWSNLPIFTELITNSLNGFKDYYTRHTVEQLKHGEHHHLCLKTGWEVTHRTCQSRKTNCLLTIISFLPELYPSPKSSLPWKHPVKAEKEKGLSTSNWWCKTSQWVSNECLPSKRPNTHRKCDSARWFMRFPFQSSVLAPPAHHRACNLHEGSRRRCSPRDKLQRGPEDRHHCNRSLSNPSPSARNAD